MLTSKATTNHLTNDSTRVTSLTISDGLLLVALGEIADNQTIREVLEAAASEAITIEEAFDIGAIAASAGYHRPNPFSPKHAYAMFCSWERGRDYERLCKKQERKHRHQQERQERLPRFITRPAITAKSEPQRQQRQQQQQHGASSLPSAGSEMGF